MIIYNVTVNIDDDVHDEWLEWMQQVHIPEVMRTGFFLANNMFRVMANDPQGTTYSIQYSCNSMNDLEEYQRDHAPGLQKKTMEKYGSKFVAFRTVLEKV
jgi:hypothetical protein